MGEWWLVVGIFSAIVLILLVSTQVMLRKKRARFASRDNLSEDDLIAKFFEPRMSRQIIIGVLEVVSKASDIPMGLLRPTDRFKDELAPERGWEFDDGISLLPLTLSKHFGGDPSDYDLTRHKTIEELIRVVCIRHEKMGILKGGGGVKGDGSH